MTNTSIRRSIPAMLLALTGVLATPAYAQTDDEFRDALIRATESREAILAELEPDDHGDAHDEDQPNEEWHDEDRHLIESLEDLQQLAPQNAALLYWAGFGLLDVDAGAILDAVRGEEEADLDLEEALELLDEASGGIELVLRASEMEDCDFGVEYQLGFNALLVHLGELRGSARLIAADARRIAMDDEIDDDERAEMVAYRMAGLLGMASHLRNDRLLISSLVSVAIASLAESETRFHLEEGSLDHDEAREYLAEIMDERFDGDDPFGVISSIEMERDIIQFWFPAALNTEDDLEEFIGQSVQTGILALADDRSKQLLGEQAARYYDEAIEIWFDDDAAEQLEVLSERVEDGDFGWLASIAGAALTRVYEADQRGRDLLASLHEDLRGEHEHEHEHEHDE
ncbi:MAG: hypothetical protein AAF747_04325 [Planctomycetota bacterium]